MRTSMSMATAKTTPAKMQVSMRRFDARRFAECMPRMPPPITADNEEQRDRPIDQAKERVIDGGGQAEAADRKQR